MCSYNAYRKANILKDTKNFLLESSKEITKSIFIKSQKQLDDILSGEEDIDG